MKILKSKLFKTIFALSILLFIYISISAFSYANIISTGLSNNILRLHVIANSDSTEDQNLKYIVRDKLLEYMNTLTKNISSKKDAINLVNSHIDDFTNIAKETIKENGYNYDVKVELGYFNFPTKSYGDITFPAGYYDALRIKIGSASGKNWWCVMFPPLCFVNTSSGIVPTESKDYLSNELSEEEFNIINSGSTDLSFKFKLVEMIENIKISIAEND